MGEKDSIKLEKTYNAPLKKVWKAITEKEQLSQWYFDFSEGWKLEPGHEFDWYAGPPGGKQWHHRGKMLEIIEGKKLSHSWEYPGYSGSSVVTWELSPVDEKTTKLRFTHEFTILFDPKEDALRRENFVEGWKQIINTSLEEYLAKLP